MLTGWMFVKALHILAGTFWVGGALMIAGFLLPASKKTGPAAGPFMGNLMGAMKLPLYMNLASWSTVIMGFLLYWRLTVGFSQFKLYWPGGIGLFIGSLAGILGLMWGSFVQAPNAKKLSGLLEQAKSNPTPELGVSIQLMQKKLYKGAWIGAGLLVISLIGMTLLH